MFSHSSERTIKWGDCDPAGIVYFPRFFVMFDEAALSLLEAAAGMTLADMIRRYEIAGWPSVDAHASFHRPVAYGDRVGIDSQVTHVGRSSVVIESHLRHEETLCAVCTQTRVCSVPAQEGHGLASAPIPDDLRQRLLARPETTLSDKPERL